MSRLEIPALLVLVIVGSLPAQAATIQINAQEYHVWGLASTTPSGNKTYTKTEATAPLSGTITASGWDGASFVEATASSSAQDFRLWAKSETDVFTEANAYAEATWTFQALSTSLKLTLDSLVDSSDYARARVMDVTTSTELLYVNCPEGVNVADYTLVFDPSHEYTLYLKVYSGKKGGTDETAIEATFAEVPEPAAALPMMLGLAIAACSRRRSV